MAASDYTTAGGGLRLKGGIEKNKKKKRAKKPSTLGQAVDDAGAATTTTSQAEHTSSDEKNEDTTEEPQGTDAAVSIQQALEHEDGTMTSELGVVEHRGAGKTKAQLQHEEMRRKRFDERLKREGVKTHKERVEALNTYLSKLSEHHDMPRIGPG